MEMPKIEVGLMINNKEIKGELQQDLLVGESNINIHIDEAPSRALYWSLLQNEAAKQLKMAQDEYRVWLAESKSTYASKEAKSETAKEDAVILATKVEYIKRINHISDLEYNLSVIRSIVEAWKSKKDLLVTLGANFRSEIETGLRIMDWNSSVKKKVGGLDVPTNQG